MIATPAATQRRNWPPPIALIETVSGLETVEAIAATDGVDALWIGHFDLSTSMGIPGAFDDPPFIAAIDRITAAAKAADVPLGQLVGRPEDGRKFIGDGFQLICYGVDSNLLRDSLAAGVAAIRGA